MLHQAMSDNAKLALVMVVASYLFDDVTAKGKLSCLRTFVPAIRTFMRTCIIIKHSLHNAK